MKRILLLFFSVISVSTAVNAQNSGGAPIDGRWTLQRCVDYAVENNVQLKQSLVQVRTNENNLKQSKFAQLPSLNASGNYNVNGGGLSINPFTNSTVNNQTFGAQSYSLSSNVTVFNGLQTRNNINRNEKQVAASKQDLLDAEQTIKLRVAQAFLNIATAQEQLKAAQIQVEATKQQVDRTEKLVNAGSLPLANLANIKAQLATEELNIITFENSIDLGILQLQQLMQLPAGGKFEVVLPDVSKLMVGGYGYSAQEVYATAESIQPSIQAAKDRIDQSLFSLQSAHGTASPSLRAFGSYSTTYSELARQSTVNGVSEVTTPLILTFPGQQPTTVNVTQFQPSFSSEKISWSKQLENNLSWSAGLSLSIPIFNGLQSKTAIQNAILGVRNAELNAEQTKNTLRQTIEQAWLDAKLASKRYSATEKQVESLREAFRTTEQRFAAGVVNGIDYTLAKTNLNRAESDLIRSKYDFIFRIKVLDFYMGKPLAF